MNGYTSHHGPPKTSNIFYADSNLYVI